jgi:hypothetical protein
MCGLLTKLSVVYAVSLFFFNLACEYDIEVIRDKPGEISTKWYTPVSGLF